MNTAIVYYSMSGNTQYVAKKLAEALNADLIPLVPKKAYPSSGFKKFFWGGKSALMGEKPALEPYGFDPKKYDRVVLCSPVWAGTFTPPLRTFLEDHGADLTGKRIAACFCCSGGPGKVLEKFKACIPDVALKQELILIDPKDKPSAENENKLNAFCDGLN